MYRCPTLSKAISFCLDMETLLVEEVTRGLISVHSAQLYWEDPEGLGGEGGGRRDRDGEYM